MVETAHAQTLSFFETHGIGQTPSSLERYLVYKGKGKVVPYSINKHWVRS